MDTAGIDAVLAAAVAAGHVPNVVAVAADRSGPIYAGAAGNRLADDPGSGPVGPDDVYRIASMTKPVVTVATLQLVERGLIDLDAVVAEHLPEFADIGVLCGFDGDRPVLRPPSTQVRVRHLICHTSGLAYDFFNPAQQRWQRSTGTPPVLAGSRGIFRSPLHFDPGTRWEYGINTDWLGLLVESVSGQSLDKYLAANITGPLGMASATFAMSAEQRALTVPVHLRAPAGDWTPSPMDLPETPEWLAGGHGLYCSARDYLRFARMLLNDGELDGARVLSGETVAEMFRDQIAPLEFPTAITSADDSIAADFILGPGWGFGLGLLLPKFDLPGMRAAFTGSWGGVFNTNFLVDRRSGIAAAYFSQCLPAGSPEIVGFAVELEAVLYDALRRGRNIAAEA